ncbi:MAG: hypothetical protein HRT36_08115 [Alphaproteobacteria bacterium]|nr:hypothetical protein [Alphaproteobacteria bacterium]
MQTKASNPAISSASGKARTRDEAVSRALIHVVDQLVMLHQKRRHPKPSRIADTQTLYQWLSKFGGSITTLNLGAMVDQIDREPAKQIYPPASRLERQYRTPGVPLP